jgi:hypothetical protein
MTLPEVDFIVAEYLKAGARPSQIRAEVLTAPHRPNVLPSGWQGVYAFRFEGVWLKVGKAGPNSNARWVSQHYNPGAAMSNLAFSLVRYAYHGETEDPRLPPTFKLRLQNVKPDDVGDFIKQHTDRYNILIDASLGRQSLTLLETIAIDSLNPVFEGRWAFGGSLS